MKRLKLSLMTAIILSISLTALAAVPQLISYQGLLKNGSGVPVSDGSYSVVFTIYDAPSGGNTIWTQTYSVATSGGLFTVLLGSGVTPIPDSAFNDTTRYLGIKVGADPEMTPRQRLSSVGYSYVSNQWTSVDSSLYRLNGKVGIGTATPFASLDVLTYTGAAIIGTSYSNGGVGVQAYGDYRALLAVNGSAAPCVEARSNYMAVSGTVDYHSPSPLYCFYGGCTNNSSGDAYGGNFGGSSYGGGVGYGVSGYGYSNTSNAFGGYFVGDTLSGGQSYGVYAKGKTYGVYGYSNTNGVVGEGSNNGVYGTSLTGIGVRGFGVTNGVYGSTPSGTGVYASSTSGYGVYATGGPNGIVAYSTSGGGSGVYGSGTYGVYGQSNGTAAVFGNINGNFGTWGGYFQGDVKVERNLVVVGNVSKAGGSFKIDHPLDPANKYLYHSFVESPDMKNIYDGLATTDATGNATVTLPDWFGALNRDFRYQLTVIGQFAQAIVSQEISKNQFSIQTDKPNVKVSWQVTGIRQDAWANAHRIPVEEEKSAADRGKYLHPEELGMSETLGINYEMTQKLAEEHKQQEEQQAKMEAERQLMEQKNKPIEPNK